MRPTEKLPLDNEVIEKLKSIIQNENKYRPRQRAQALLLKYKEVSAKDIAFALNVRVETVYDWIRKFKTDGIESLFDKEGRGRKSIFKDIPKDEIKELIDTKASVSIINANIKEKYDISVSNESVRKFIKKTFI